MAPDRSRTAYIIIHRASLVASRCHNVEVIAQVTGLDEADVRYCLEEYGRVDSDEYTAIPEEPPRDHTS